MESMIVRTPKQLTKQQSNIVGSNEYPMYLRAGAGTGKTEVLVQKILHILSTEDDVSLANFAIITFTNKATEEMQNRISSALFSEWLRNSFTDCAISDNMEVVNMVDICTIHSFCERLIQRYGLQINIAPNFKVKSFKKETADIIASIVNEYCHNPLLSEIPAYTIEKLVSVFLSNNSNRGIRVDEKLTEALTLPAPDNHYWNAFKVLFLEIYNRTVHAVEAEKQRCNILTPNDLIRMTADLLQKPSVVNRIAIKYKYIFIDEFQDTNKDQFNLVDCLIKNGVKVFLVGDEKQSIYAFRGADVQNSQEMHSLINRETNNGEQVRLSENFRSTRELIAAINDTFSHTFTYNGETLSFPIEPLDTPECAISENNTEPILYEYEKPVTDIIREVLNDSLVGGKPIEYGDVAILCRRNFDLDKISAELKAAGIPTRVVGGKGFYRTQEVIDTYKVLNAIVIGGEAALHEVKFTDYYKAIQDIDINRFMLEMQSILRIETVDAALVQLYERSCILDYYRHRFNYQAVSNLHKLVELSQTLMDRDNMQPMQFVEYLYIMISTNQDEDEADIPEVERNNGVVSLYSIHKAKGLSFPIVIIPNCDNKLNRPITKPKIIMDLKSERPALAFNFEIINPSLIPDKEYGRLLDNNIKELLEEEIRVFYVACTRAEKQIVIASTNSKDKIMQTLRYRDYASVSRWLLEMQNGGKTYDH